MDTSSNSRRKRPFFEDDDDDDDDSNKPPPPKKVRFPKGKKVKPGNEAVAIDRSGPVEVPSDIADPRIAAKERAKRRSQFTSELFSEESRGSLNDISAAEMSYEDTDNFTEDGIEIEPFNLEKERQEGYFDAEGNFVEYVNQNDFKDAWLDSVEVDPKLAKRASTVINDENDVQDLSSEDIGNMKRRIADLLESGETVLQALRRLKGTSNKKKDKMSAETKVLFDQLTEDAMKLMENGEYNVYHEKQEVFEREAEGYERLARARGGGTSVSAGNGISESIAGRDLFSNTTNSAVASSGHLDTAAGPSNSNLTTAEISSNGGDEFDMFADDEENGTGKPSFNENILVSGSNSGAVSLPSSDALNMDSESGAFQNDYLYDESSGYYYSSSLGYYYDPSTGLYCSATSGQWYSFNEETGSYDEVQEVASNVN